MFLGLCDAKPEITSELSDNLETLALNDKESYGIAFKSLMFFSTFLGNSNNAIVDEKVLPQCQFIMNRSKKLTGIIAELIGLLKTYKIESDATLNLWLDMLSSE